MINSLTAQSFLASGNQWIYQVRTHIGNGNYEARLESMIVSGDTTINGHLDFSGLTESSMLRYSQFPVHWSDRKG